MNSETITCQGAALSERHGRSRACCSYHARHSACRSSMSRLDTGLGFGGLGFAANMACRASHGRSDSAAPWHVMVSEFMLQQTPVVRVLPVYWQWVRRWPHPADLAAVASGE